MIMRHFLILLLLVSFIPALGQQKNKLQVSFQLQPELTFHQNQYSYRWREKHTKSTFNIGFSTAVQYNFTNRLFVDIGLGYLSRKLNTSVFLDQATLPAPHYSATKELNHTQHLSYRTLQIPANFGYKFINKQTFNSYFVLGVSANYLLNASYKVGNPQYDDTYKKDYWQGVSFNGGLGADIRLIKNIFLFNSITYSFINPVQADKFLFSQDEKEIALPHNYLRVSTGIKIPL